jgi:hypothetical protein
MDVGSFTMSKIRSAAALSAFALRNGIGCLGLTQAPRIGKSIDLARFQAVRPQANLTYHVPLPPSRL